MHHDLATSNQARTLRVPSTPLALALVLALGSAPLVSRAATISVNSAADTSPSSACTLRDAIASMNAAALVGGCANTGDAFGSHDTILFDTGVFPTDGGGTITLSGSRLALTATNVVMDATANGNVTIDANHASGVMIDTAPAGSTLELRHLTLTNGNVTTTDCEGYAEGGGICIPYADLTLVHSTLSGNSAGSGGGIFSYGKVTLKHSTLSGNAAAYGGGGIFGLADIVLENSTVSDNSAGTAAGGIYHYGGNVTLTNSTLSGNSASAAGGGIVSVYANVTFTNSTLSGNSTSGTGGGLYNFGGNVTLANSTLSGNSAGESGGGIFAYAYDYGYGEFSVEAINSIIAGNTQPDSDIVGVTPTGSGNLIGVVGNLNLGPLADNGGTTWTMLPLAGSAAIDAVACTEAPATDQRGVSRPQGTLCDIGAVEVDLGVIFADGFEGVGPSL